MVYSHHFLPLTSLKSFFTRGSVGEILSTFMLPAVVLDTMEKKFVFRRRAGDLYAGKSWLVIDSVVIIAVKSSQPRPRDELRRFVPKGIRETPRTYDRARLARYVHPVSA